MMPAEQKQKLKHQYIDESLYINAPSGFQEEKSMLNGLPYIIVLSGLLVWVYSSVLPFKVKKRMWSFIKMFARGHGILRRSGVTMLNLSGVGKPDSVEAFESAIWAVKEGKKNE